MIELIAFVFGLVIGYKLHHARYSGFLRRRRMQRYWKKHPYQKKFFIVLGFPIAILVLWPIDYVKYGTTFKEYIETFKQVWND